MKVLSVREPYASLIKNEIKYIETRSWKTKFRGKILIHSCKGKYPVKNTVKHLIDIKELQYGFILCEAEIIDCIYIDKIFVEKTKKENFDNYLCGDYSEGRYAWVLSNIKAIDEPIEIGGQLGLWNYMEDDVNEN